MPAPGMGPGYNPYKAPKKRSKSYTVRTGDTLSSLAKRFGIPDTQLAQANQGVGIQPGNVVTVPDATAFNLPPPQQYFGGPGGKPAGWNPNTFNWLPGGAAMSANILNRIGSGISNWWNMRPDVGWNATVNPTYRQTGIGEVQRYGYAPTTQVMPTNLTGQLPTGRTHPNLIRPGSEPQPIAPTAAGEVTGGNYQEKLPYGKSYNYSVNTGEIPNPGSVAAVKYGDEATYNLARAMVDGYGYDYGNYLSWAAENNIQQPASYYSWKSTQGVTHSGQSSQFWEYMQGLSIGKGGGQNLREKLEQKGKMKNIKKYNKKWREARGLEPYEFPEQETGQATQTAYHGNAGRYYSAPASMGLVTWRT